MSQPTVSIGFSPTTPAAPSGDQNAIPQSDNGVPLQKVSFYPQKATASLRGTVKPDGTTTQVDASGNMTAKTMVGDLGSGGSAGIVPAPPAGSAAAGKFLKADATWVPVGETAGITIDGGAVSPAPGSKGFLQVPFAGTITGWTLIADQSGSASITVKKSTFAAFPTNSSIVASAPPALSSQQIATSSTLTGWTTAIAAGDVLEFVLASASTLLRLTLELQITRS